MPPNTKCVVKESDVLEMKDGQLYLNGTHLPTLKGCLIVGQPSFSLPIVEVPVQPAAPAPAAQPAAPAPAALAQPAVQKSALTEEVGEVREIIEFVKEVADLPPIFGIIIVAAFIFMKMHKSKSSAAECKAHLEIAPKLEKLNTDVASLTGRVGDLERSITKTMLQMMDSNAKREAGSEPTDKNQ